MAEIFLNTSLNRFSSLPKMVWISNEDVNSTKFKEFSKSCSSSYRIPHRSRIAHLRNNEKETLCDSTGDIVNSIEA